MCRFFEELFEELPILKNIDEFSIKFSQVFVASSLTNLYERVKKKEWKLIYTGVPVLLYDKGSTRCRTQPRVTFVLAERGTCFALWKDTIDNLSSYKTSGPAFHTMCLSTGNFKHFDEPSEKFLTHR